MSGLAVHVFVGGGRVAAVPPDDRGLAYGDGLFETMRVHGGRLPWGARHLARLALGAARLGLPAPDAGWLRGRLAALLSEGPSDAVCKLVLTRGAGGRGYARPPGGEPTLVLSLHPLPAPPARPLVLRWCETRLALQPALAGLKHLNRLEQVLARAEWRDPGIDEGLVLDGAGRVACATAANVLVHRDGRWLTPSVHEAGVAGIARGWLLEAGLVQEGELHRDDVAAADALALCNAVRGILPVGRLEERTFPPHPATAALCAELGRHVPAFAPGS